MVSHILDLSLIAIVLFCAWRGFRTGIINGMCGILAVVVALFGAHIISTAYSSEFTGMLEPFATGLVDSLDSSLRDYVSGKTTDFVPESEITAGDIVYPERESEAILRKLSFTEGAAQELSEEIADRVDETEERVLNVLVDFFCERVCYIVIFAIAFILIMIVFSVVSNVLDLSFGIPGHENLNHISGALLGIVRGVLIVVTITCLCRYMGIIFSDEILSKTHIFGKLVSENRLAEFLMI